jgi:hypothetical protein
MESSDTQPDLQTTSANTEINALTDSLEQPPTEDATGPIKDVTTFWTRLDSLLTNLEETEATKKKPAFKSFINQPERVNISSDSDINITQSQDAITEQTFSSFKVNIARPFLDVKSIQLLRASIPNAVTNIPDEECVFWYYRIPTFTFSGTITVVAPTPPLQPTPTPDDPGYTGATFTTAGVISPAVAIFGISQVFVGSPGPGYVTFRCASAVTGLAAGSRVTIAGVSPAGYNGTFNVYSVPGGGFPNDFVVVLPNLGAATLSGATVTTVITDFIDWGTVPYSVCNVAGVPFGYFFPPETNPETVSIYISADLSGATIGTITRSSDLFMPAPSFQYLHMIRLLPSFYKTELFNSDDGQDTNLPPNSFYGYNRTFSDYQDLASELSRSSLADPAYDLAVDANSTFPLFIPADISITFNQTLNKFIFTGNNISVKVGVEEYLFARYLSAGYNDVNLWNTALMNTNDNTFFGVPISAPQLYAYTADEGTSDYSFIRGASGQPWQIYRTLNLRLGFTWNGSISQIASAFPINMTVLSGAATKASVIVSYYNRLRPVPDYVDVAGPFSTSLGGPTDPYTVTYYTADSYANLVYTNTVSLYADFTGGSTYDSIGNTQLLACVPMNASNLGVTFYNATLYCPLTKISDQIYEIEIRMLTDTGAPYVIPNSCIVSLELALTY